MHRLFFALLPDDSTQLALQQISAALPLSSRQRIRTELWHVTLVFIGSVNEDIVASIINATPLIKMPTISLIFDQLTYWKRAQVTCLTCSQPESAVTNLVTQLSTPLADLSLKLDSRPYCPHVTLARHIHALPAAIFQPIIWTANEFALMESVSDATGVIYRPLQFWQLQNNIADS